MKKILAALLASYALQTNAQGPPGTTAAPGTTTAATTGAVQPPPPPVPPAAPVTTTPPLPPLPPQPPIPVPPAEVIPVATTAAPVPITPAPTTGAPTTAAPTFNPYCPPGAALQAIGSHNPFQFGGVQLTQTAACRVNTGPGSIARDYEGQLTCDNFHCCLCSEINCGGTGMPCENLKIGDSGAVGVQNIVAIGPNIGWFMGAFGWQNGAQIECNGLEGCKRSKIRGQYVHKMQCSGDFGCEGADIMLEPSEQMDVQCNGMMSCMNAAITIIIGPNTNVAELGTIECNGQQSCQGLSLTIRNLGATPVMLRDLECMNPTACPNLRINIEGPIMIENCDLQGVQMNTLPPQIQQCQLNQIGGMNNNIPNLMIPGYNPFNPGFPAPAPAQPAPGPQQPIFPGAPAQPITPPVNPQPNTPVGPVAPAPGTLATPAQFLPFNANQQLDCTPMLCANKIITIQPSNSWKLNCPLPGSCTGLQLTLNVGMDPLNPGHAVERIDSFTFGGASSGVNAKITINYNGGGMFGGFGFYELNDVRCENFGSCTGLQIISNGLDLTHTNFDCQQPGACNGCTATFSGQTHQCMALHQMQNQGNPFAGYNPNQFNQGPYNPVQPAQPQTGFGGYPQGYYPYYI